jgi:hypothetical protein
VNSFVHKHADKITSSLFCPDRLIFKGYLPFCYPQAMENFLAHHGVLLKDFERLVPSRLCESKPTPKNWPINPVEPFASWSARSASKSTPTNSRGQGITEGLITVKRSSPI